MLPPFQAFFDAHSDAVIRFLTASVGPQEAEDCFQETFLAALRAYPRLRDGTNLKAWVFRIAHRKAIDSHRTRERRLAMPPPAAQPPPEPADAALWSAVASLPAKQRSAVLLRAVDDLPYAQVGAIIGCSEAAARRNAHEGLKKLREVLR